MGVRTLAGYVLLVVGSGVFLTLVLTGHATEWEAFSAFAMAIVLKLFMDDNYKKQNDVIRELKDDVNSLRNDGENHG